MLTELIDKQDVFEIIRDKIALILKNESVNQFNLAAEAGKNTDDWELNVYTERTSPWEGFSETCASKTPIVNVWFDNATFSDRASNTVESQKAQGTFNIDCIGYGVSSGIDGGHESADEAAAKEAARAIRLVRNIIMSGENTYLQLRGIVAGRWPQSINAFRLQSDNGSIQKCMGMRLALTVSYLEFSPQYQPQSLEHLSVDVRRKSDGAVIAEADYQYPLTGE